MDVSSSNPEDVLSALNSLGMPDLTEEEFARIRKGRMAEVLDFVALHVVGRVHTSTARNFVQQARESRGGRQSHADHEVDPLYHGMRKAESHTKNARVSFSGTQENQAEQARTLRSIEQELIELQSVLEDKRLSIVLLSILERKEKIRNERFSEISKLIEALRMKNIDVGQESSIVSMNCPKSLYKPLRAEYSRDTLSALQAHSLCVSRLQLAAQSDTRTRRSNEIEQRLTRSIAESLGLQQNDQEVLSTLQKLQAVGHSRARTAVGYHSPMIAEKEEGDDLRDISKRIDNKEAILQGLADESAALTVGCAQCLHSIAKFNKATSPALRDGIRGESRSCQGYIDVLRLSIVNREAAAAEKAQDRGLCRGRSFAQTLSNVHLLASKVQEIESFLQQVDTLLSPDTEHASQSDSLIELNVKENEELDGRLKKLLERKARKTEAGNILLQDIERLVSEVNIIAGLISEY